MICRGCAGNGIGQHVSPRDVQIAIRPIELTHEEPSEYNGVTSRSVRYRTLLVSSIEHPERGRKRGIFRGPLADVIAEYDRLVAEGFYDGISGGPAVPPNPEWACPWCHGTGEPQLSEHAIEQALATARTSDGGSACQQEQDQPGPE